MEKSNSENYRLSLNATIPVTNVPMSGLGQRFLKAGYKFKTIIKVDNQEIISYD